MKNIFNALFVMCFIAACGGTKQQPVQSQGQEGHGGDLAVTRARTAIYMNVVSHERHRKQREFLTPGLDLFSEYSLPNWKITSSANLYGKFWEWIKDDNGQNVLVVNRERMRTIDNQQLMEQASSLLFGYPGAGAGREMLVTDLTHMMYSEQRTSELFGSENEKTRQRIIAMFNRIRDCNPQSPTIGGPWHNVFRDARAEVMAKADDIKKHVANLPLIPTTSQLFASTSNAQVDFLTEKFGRNKWRISQDIVRSAGWEAHPDLISAVLTHEVAHTLGFTSADSDYIYSFSTLYCM